jgi:hypothetical protein
MSSFGHEFNEVTRERLNQFVIHGLVQNVIGEITVSRLVQLDDKSSLCLFDDYVREALIDCPPFEIPLAQGLRTKEDFSEGEDYLLKTPYFRSMEHVIVSKIFENEVELELLDSTKSVIPVDYPGLVSKSDFDYYVSKRPGRGSAYSKIGFNLELTRMMSAIGLISYDNDEIVRKTKRIFEVSAKQYRHRVF